MYYTSTENLEKVADMVIVNVKHELTPSEFDEQGQQMAQAVNDKAAKENEKKVIVADFSNKIKELEARIKLHAGYISSGFMMVDRSAEMYRDYARAKRVYFDKGTGLFIKEEDFQHGDYQRKLDLEASEQKLQEEDIARQQQIEYNNQIGNIAEGSIAQGLYAPLDEVILDKKLKPVPKNNLPDNYGHDLEGESENALPNPGGIVSSEDTELPDGFYRDEHDNLTDIAPDPNE